MIHSVSANQKSFHTVEFTTGLNVIVAERSDTSTERDTRNGVGKSTLIEIIDFCLGGRSDAKKGLLIDPLKDWAFTLEITLAGNRVQVTRAIADSKKIIIDGVTKGWIYQPKHDLVSRPFFLEEEWGKLLGWALFGISRLPDDVPYKPAYRSLVSYLIRNRDGAYQDPFKHFSQQKTWNWQLSIAYLLGMNWEYAARWQVLKDQEARLKASENLIKDGLDSVNPSIGELRTRSVKIEHDVNKTKAELDSFKVHPQYESIQQEADQLTREIHQFVNDNVSDLRRLNQYRDAVEIESPPSDLTLERLYAEAGIVFADSALRSLTDAREFHRKVIANRRDFLKEEITNLERAIEQRKNDIENLTAKRAKVMRILETHGALQEMIQLQERYVELKNSLDRVQIKLDDLKKVGKGKQIVKSEKAELHNIAVQDHEQRKAVWSRAVTLFNDHSTVLYKTAGDLVIEIGSTGYKYRVDISRSGSEGIEKMKIFCFDLAVLQMQRQVERGVDFIIHDTLMYDSVDPRQRALAFQRAHEVTTAIDSQYICTINSDMIPTDVFTAEFDFQDHVRLKLSDLTPSDSLLGIRFERSSK